VSAGVNTAALKFFEQLDLGYEPPGTTKTFIREYYLGEESVERIVGNSMHVFLLNLPRIEFAAIIPKGDYVTVCMLGEDINNDLVQSFMDSPEVKACLPAEAVEGLGSCQCAPRMNVRGAVKPFADRIIFIGDSGVTRLYKDGIGGAYRTAKAAATAAVLQGISADSLKRHFWPVCRSIQADNAYGRLAFRFTREVQKRQYARRAILRMTALEQKTLGSRLNMSRVLWDVFTGSAPYKEIFLRILHPRFIVQFAWNLLISIMPLRKLDRRERDCIDSR
jgi:flavin-dependent dehydrogenase